MAPALPYAAVALMAIGTSAAAYGQVQQGKSQTAMAEYNAKLARRNAKTARESAEYEARQKRRGTARLIGKQRALYAKAGITMEGSPLDVLQETAAQGEMDALMIERGYTQQAAAYLSQAELAKMRAKQYKQQGYWGAGTTLLTNAGQMMSGFGGKKNAKDTNHK